jgi:hypothetical protein
MIRVIINVGVTPLTGINGCNEDRDGMCELSSFVKGQKKIVAETDWDGDVMVIWRSRKELDLGDCYWRSRKELGLGDCYWRSTFKGVFSLNKMDSFVIYHCHHTDLGVRALAIACKSYIGSTS